MRFCEAGGLWMNKGSVILLGFLLFFLTAQGHAFAAEAADWGGMQTEKAASLDKDQMEAAEAAINGELETEERVSGEEELALEEKREEDEVRSMLAELNLGRLDGELQQFAELPGGSFTSLVQKLVRGEVPFQWEALWEQIKEILFAQLRCQRKLAVQILVIALISSVFSNFIRVFENSQIAEISFYMIYLLLSSLLVRAFFSMDAVVTETLQNLIRFVRLLLPSYLTALVFSSGGVSALGFYQVTVLAVHLLQSLLLRVVLPMIQFYLVLLILNQMSKEDIFSKLAELLRTFVEWTVRTVSTVTLGFHAVQCLIAPAVDGLKNSALHRLAKSVPGVGGLLDAAAETVAGSAVVVKNAVGVAGMVMILAICLVPVIKLAAGILMFRLLCALIQPVCEKRMVSCVESISDGASLLMRLLLTGMAMFLLLFAMITASVKGG